MRPLLLSAVIGLAAALLVPAPEAEAQWNNAPYQPSFRGAAGGVGMSPGYRQVIILDRLSDRVSRNNLYRSPEGFLLEVARRDGQAFVISPQGFPTAAQRPGLMGSGMGYGLSTPRYRQGGPGYLRGDAARAFNGWWPMIAGEGSGRGAVTLATTPIDSWIAQLNSL